MSTIERYKFKVGDTGLTRDGRKFRVICTDKISVNPEYVLVALVTEKDGTEQQKIATVYGTFIDPHKSAIDLMPPRPKMYVDCPSTFWRLHAGTESTPVAYLRENVYCKKEAKALFAKMFDGHDIVDMT